jgi:type I restriction enzyme R subunit
MSALLDEIIAARKAKAIDYEQYLKRIADLARRVEAGQPDDAPAQLNTPGRRALYNNLAGRIGAAGKRMAEEQAAYMTSGDDALVVTLKIDETIKRIRPDGWRGVQARENAIKRALYGILRDEAEVERIFLIVKQQREY